MTKTHYRLVDHLSFNDFVIAHRRFTRDTFCDAIGIKKGKYIEIDRHSSNVIHLLLFKNEKDAIKLAEDEIRKYVHAIRKYSNDWTDGEKKKRKVSRELIDKIMKRDYRIMTLKWFLDSKRWNIEYAEMAEAEKLEKKTV